MSEHLFLGDSTYPHTPAFPTGLADQLRFCANAFDNEFGHNLFSLTITKSAERIEQLERELKQEKTRYTGCFHMLIAEQDSNAAMQSKIDAAISEVKK